MILFQNNMILIIQISLNPYSVLTPPGGVLGLLKIIHLIFTRKTTNMSDALRVKYKKSSVI